MTRRGAMSAAQRQNEQTRAFIRSVSLRHMGVQNAHDVLPTEILREQFDGFDVMPARRQFARVVELFEHELRQPAPGVAWTTLTKGALVPPIRYSGRPSLADRTARRVYNEYCEPEKDFQPSWNAETIKIERLTRQIDHLRRLEFMGAIGVTVGLGAGALYAASFFVGAYTFPMLSVYVAACVLSFALYLWVRSQRQAIDD